jgi:hypothetical protein
MFRAKTLFIVGAGASFEVGLPIGSELLTSIVELVDIRLEQREQTRGSPAVLEALKARFFPAVHETVDEHIRAGWQLAASAQQAISIDNLIDALEDPKIEVMGKLGIAQAILQAEGKSAAFRPTASRSNELDISTFSGTWYATLTKLLTEGVRRSEVDGIFSNLEIINFNYDRCLEQYLPYSLAQYYGLDVTRFRAILATLPIHRPYGSVGRLPWQAGVGPAVEFGCPEPQSVADVSRSLRTFTEQVSDEDALQAMRAAVSGADRIVFLGFGFHRQNLELISSSIRSHSEILGTAMGVSRSDLSVIDDEIWRGFELRGPRAPYRVELEDATCDRFLREHWRTLTAEPSDFIHEDLLARSVDLMGSRTHLGL